jgi:hypothetical protein
MLLTDAGCKGANSSERTTFWPLRLKEPGRHRPGGWAGDDKCTICPVNSGIGKEPR